MAISNIKGSQVALYLEKEAGTGEFTRFACADSLSLTINTEEIEVTAECDDVEDEETVVFKAFENGAIDWSGSIGGGVRRIDGADAAKNISSSELVAFQLAGRKLLLRYTEGTAAGSNRMQGTIFFTQNNPSGGGTDKAQFSANFRGTGKLEQVKVTAPA
jgi:hypothetical protein